MAILKVFVCPLNPPRLEDFKEWFPRRTAQVAEEVPPPRPPILGAGGLNPLYIQQRQVFLPIESHIINTSLFTF